MNSIKKLLLRAVLITITIGQYSIAAIYAAAPPSNITSYLTAEDNEGIPGYTKQTDFTCTDQVYMVMETGFTEGEESAQHTLTVHWRNPNGKVEERTQYDFTHYEQGARVWAWLRLSGPPGAAIARLFDPAFGMGKFIGTWKVEVKVGKKKVATHSFDVLC